MKDEGRTIVFVTHDMGVVERFCDRATADRARRGREMGEPADDRARLQRAQLRAAGALSGARGVRCRCSRPASEGPPVSAPRRTAIQDAWFENLATERVVALSQGAVCRARFAVRIGEDMLDPIFAITLRNEAHHTVMVLRTDWRHGRTGSLQGQ